MGENTTNDKASTMTGLKAIGGAGPPPVTTDLALYDIPALQLDELENWLRPEYPRYESELAPAKPFLVPSFDDTVVEILPSVKQNRKINFDENVYVMEIENRFQMLLPEEQVEEDDEVSYEIEIVEGGQTDDADFYLEMIDGEIFYVFETEDDISEGDDSDDSDDSSDNSSSETEDRSAKTPIQFDIAGMMAPNLNDSFAVSDEDGSPGQKEQQSSGNVGEDKVEITFDLEADATPAVATKSTAPSTEATTPVPQEEKENIQASRKEGEIQTSFSSPPSSPVGKSPGTNLVSPTRSILKTCPPSPKIDSPRKSKKKGAKKGEKKEKTFTKTYVRADDFDGEHRVFAWEKPSWAGQNKLRQTGKGDAILKGGSLAAPITDAHSLIDSGKVKWEKPEWAKVDDEDDAVGETDVNAQDVLIRKIQESGLNLPKKRKGGRSLKITLNGSALRDGTDIVKPVTKATVIKKNSNINTIANPKILRATQGGSKVKEGFSLEMPTTSATTLKKYTFEKPSWATKSTLRSTTTGDILKKGGDVVMPITPATAAQNTFNKPDWKAKRGIGRGGSEPAVMDSEKKKEYSWEKPSWASGAAQLKKTAAGDVVRTGKGDIARPITHLSHIIKEADELNQSTASQLDHHDDTGPPPQLASGSELPEKQTEHAEQVEPAEQTGQSASQTDSENTISRRSLRGRWDPQRPVQRSQSLD